MKKYKRHYYKSLILLVFINFSTLNFAQEQSPINVFTPQQYGAENQNWAISQSQNKYIYVANNLGLLEYNGANWKLYNSPNETIMRSVKVVGDKIYSGCYMQFGYWQPDEFGLLKYKSLSKTLSEPLIEDEQFWQIISIDKWVLFRSLNRIYMYDSINESFKIINSPSTITNMFQIDDTIYYQSINIGVFKLQNGKSILLTNEKSVTNNPLVNVFKDNGGLLFLTQENGFYKFQDKAIKPTLDNANKLLSNYSIYSSIRLKDKTFAIGTISNGFIHLDRDGKLIQNVDQTNGLTNNTVLTLFEDIDLNIWLGLDNGINNININSPIRIFDDKRGDLGTIYTSAIFEKNLYLGTNQGLFYKRMNSNDLFKLLEGTKGQVWCLVEINETLFCGHNSGTFIITNQNAEKISNIQGAWSLKRIDNNKDLLLQGNYNGLNVLEKRNNKWTHRNKIKGFDISSRFFEFINTNEVLISHEYKGVFNVKINVAFTKATKVVTDTIHKGLHSSLFKHNNNIYYAYSNGVYKYDLKLNSFEKDSLLSTVYTKDNYVSGKLISDPKTGDLWSFSKNDINVITSGKLSETPKINNIEISNMLRKGVPSYENMLNLGNNKYLFGTSSGYIIIDFDEIKKETNNININNINVNAIRNKTRDLNKTEIGDLKNAENNISFKYSVPEFNKFQNVEYQHQLLGIYNQWSDWSSNSSVLYKNLPAGEYTFNVKGKVGDDLTANMSSYTFEIQKPWYLTKTMIAIYVIGAILLLLITHNLYNRYYRIEREKLLKKTKQELERKELENAQQLMQFENEKLQQDIEIKNRELASSTMSLIKKNEFLNTLKKELNATTSGKNLNPVIKIIDKNLNNTNDWEMFQEAFNNADKDFLKKVKGIHPVLTPNDLRLCAYLRLNLSSKEIAPLLNISPRSVEVKRYRLRKKMELSRETSLTNYILDL